jgi:hypothetical protein
MESKNENKWKSVKYFILSEPLIKINRFVRDIQQYENLFA